MTLEAYDWNLIKSFIAVLESGSLSAASRRLGVSQPTLGRHIDELERALAVTLFDRGREGLVPTESALAISGEANRIAASASAIALSAAGRSRSVEGTVRITASEVVSVYLLTGVLGEVLENWPLLQIELVPSDEVQNLLRRDADIAVRMVRPVQRDLVARKVNQFSIGLYVHAEYAARCGLPKNVAELSGHVIVGYDRSDLIIRGFERHGIHVGRDFFRFRTDNQVAAWAAVNAGLGIGFGPNFIARRNPDLIRVAADLQVEALPMWLATHREIQTSIRIRTVFDELAQRLSALELG